MPDDGLVEVVIQVDDEERKVSLPADLTVALDQNPEANRIIQGISYSHQKQYVEWIERSKQVETRERRILRAIEKLPKGWNPKDKRSS